MKCDRCKTDQYSCWDLIPIDYRHLRPELGYKKPLGGGKLLFCKECAPIVDKGAQPTPPPAETAAG